MDKVARLVVSARDLATIGTGGILGAGAGISAKEQIAKNRRNARAVKGWNTRRRRAASERK